MKKIQHKASKLAAARSEERKAIVQFIERFNYCAAIDCCQSGARTASKLKDLILNAIKSGEHRRKVLR